MSKKYSLAGNVSRLWRFLMTKATHEVDCITEAGMHDELTRLSEEAKQEIASQADSAENLLTARNSFQDMHEKTLANREVLSKKIAARARTHGSPEACQDDAELCRWMTQRVGMDKILIEQEAGMKQLNLNCVHASEMLANARVAEQQIQMELELTKHRIQMSEITGQTGTHYGSNTVRNRLNELRDRVSQKEFRHEARQEVAQIMGDCQVEQDSIPKADFSEFFGQKSEERQLNG